MKNVDKNTVYNSINNIFENNLVVGDTESRMLLVESGDVSLPIQKGSYTKASILVHLAHNGFKNTAKLHNLVNDYFTENKELFRVDKLPMPKWSSSIQIKRKQYQNIEFISFDIDKEKIDNILSGYKKSIFKLAEKRMGLVKNGLTKKQF